MASIRLDPLGPGHIPALELLIEDPGVLRFTRIPDPPPPGFAELWLAACETGRREGTREGFAIIEEANGDVLGVAVAPTIDRAARTVELGYLVDPAARGRGVASEALRQLTRWAFEELHVLRAELRISVANEASKRVAARCGYSREGVLRSLHVKQDVREDTEIWSRLPDDPGPN